MKYLTILAAGKGTRMNGFAAIKPLAPIADTWAILHLISSALDTGIEYKKIFIVINELYEEKHLKSIGEFIVNNGNGVDYEFCLQSIPQLGTGHAVKCVIDKFNLDTITTSGNSSMLILYADTPLLTSESIKDIYNYYEQNVNECTGIICSFDCLEPNQYGRVELDSASKYVKQIHEYKDYRGKQEITSILQCNSGIVCVSLKTIMESIGKIGNDNKAGEYYLPNIITCTSENFKAYKIKDSRQVLGFNTIRELNNIEAIYWQMQREKFAERNIRFIDINTVYLGMNVVIEDNAIIDINVKLGPNVYIGKATYIKSHTVISDSKIGASCEIGPSANLMSGVVMGDKNIIGNYVEVKRAKFGNGNKAKHLAYLADCTVGDNNNFGAGVIMCNYDGKNKHQTVIGSNNMIGANSSLIAPLNIGSNNLVAAGSVINKDIGSGVLAIARVKQENKEKK